MAELTDSNLPTAAYITFIDGAAPPAGAASIAAALEERLGGFSGLPVAELTMDVGGAGLLLGFSHPTRTLAYARALVALARSPMWDLPALRIGVHVASVAPPSEAGAEATISGSSVDGAVRIAGVAEANQALATAQFQTVVVRLLKLGAGSFTPLGKRTTASGKTLEVFEITVDAGAPPPQARAARAPAHAGPATEPAPPAARAAPPSAPLEEALDAQRLAQIEEALATEIGPIAKILVNKASGLLPDQNRFLVRLADAVPEPDRRRAFLAKATQIAAGG